MKNVDFESFFRKLCPTFCVYSGNLGVLARLFSLTLFDPLHRGEEPSDGISLRFINFLFQCHIQM